MKACFQRRCLPISGDFAVSYGSFQAVEVLQLQSLSYSSDSRDFQSIAQSTKVPLTNLSNLITIPRNTSDFLPRGLDQHNLPTLSPPMTEIGQFGQRKPNNWSYLWPLDTIHQCTIWSYFSKQITFVGRSSVKILYRPSFLCRLSPFQLQRVELNSGSYGWENRRSFEYPRFFL